MEEQFNKIKAEELEKVCVKEEHISPDHEESDINENVHIKDNIIISKEDNSEIHQKIYIKEEELSCDEDGDSETMCETNYSNGYSHASQLHMNGYSMSIDRTPVDVSVCSKSVGCKPVDFSVSVEVFLKEERDVDEACHISDGVEVEENLSNLRKVEETFGNHFLTAYDEPQVGGQNQFEMDATGLIPEIEHSENEQLKNQGVSLKMAKKTQKENSDTYEKKKKLAAERQRRFKARMSEEQLEKRRETDRERRRKLRQEKKIKPISEMKASEQRKMRKDWKKYSATYRKKKQSLQNALPNTQPLSNDEEMQSSSTQKERGRRQVCHDRAKSYRKIKKQEKEIQLLQKKVEMYKKRLQQEKKKQKNMSSPSPAKRVKDLVSLSYVSPKVKNQLFIGYALEKQLHVQLNTVSPKAKDRQVMLKSIESKILKKYRVQKDF